jgi:hypothetical protein
MKTKLLLIVIIAFALFSSEINSQCNVEDILIRLNSESPNVRFDAVVEIMHCKLEETLNDLEERFAVEDNLSVANILLEVINRFNSLNIVQLAHQLISKIDDNFFNESDFSSYNGKIYATQKLFKHNDYSTSQIVIEYIDRFSADLHHLELLNKIIQNVPGLEQSAKTRVEQILNQTDSELNITSSMRILAENYGEEYRDLILDKFLNGGSYAIRKAAFEMLFTVNYSAIHSLLLERLTQDENRTIRRVIADSLLKVWGTPGDLKAVMDYQPDESDTIAKSLMGLSIQRFIPPRPGDNVATAQMIDNLIRYVEDLTDYEWILPNAQFDFYNFAKEIYNSYQNEQYDVAMEICLLIIEQAEDALANEEITVEGYKFLHYYPTYIKERIEEEL